jgi:guanylate kinase
VLCQLLFINFKLAFLPMNKYKNGFFALGLVLSLLLSGNSFAHNKAQKPMPYKSMCQNVFFIISGPSGTGKTVAMNALMHRHPNITKLVSTTDRAMRRGEKDGVDYKFKTKSEYKKLVAKDLFIENLQVYNNNYGILKSDLKSLLKNKNDVIVDLNVEGALQVKQSVNPEEAKVVLVYLMPPAIKELRSRLNGRGTDSKEIIDGRMAQAISQLEGFENYDIIIDSGDRNKVLEKLSNLYQALVLKRETCLADKKVAELRSEYEAEGHK